MAKSDKIDEIIKALKAKKATESCPACGHPTFTLVDGYFRQDYITIEGQHPLGLLGLPNRRFLHYIVLVCDNCGYLRQHATQPLKLTSGEKGP